MLKIRRAIISVWEKKGITELAKILADLKVEIISTGKTAFLLKQAGIPVKEVSELTKFPEILSGRVKTLHPFIFGGILANKKHPLHMEEVKSLGISPIDMVVVNLYPFAEKAAEKLSLDEMIEYIDVGGTALLRSAAKNFKNVASISSLGQYKAVIDELRRTQGFLSEETLKQLAIDTFSLTREYDNQIYNYFRGGDSVTLDLEKVLSLRYGENPHQGAALYKIPGDKNLKFCRLQGKELSFNNILDLDTAMAMCKEFSEPAAIIVKHASLCGVGVDKKIAGAFHKAHLTDPISSFGGIISLNRKVDKDTAIKIMKSDFKECVIAPGYSNEAIKIFSAKKNLRVLEADFEQALDFKDIRTTLFGYLIQDRDLIGLDKDNLKIVTRKKPTQSELKDILFAWKVVKYVKSNAIVVAKGLRVCGIGAGQPSRVGSAKIALEKAGQVCKGAVLASDGFFPKEDTIKLAYRKGIRAIIQPGGSIKDQDIIKLCDQLKISMIFTNVRHFRH